MNLLTDVSQCVGRTVKAVLAVDGEMLIAFTDGGLLRLEEGGYEDERSVEESYHLPLHLIGRPYSSQELKDGIIALGVCTLDQWNDAVRRREEQDREAKLRQLEELKTELGVS